MSFSDWNPMEDDYNNLQYNSYDSSHSRSGSVPPSATLYVSDVLPDFNWDSLNSLFSQYGKVVRIFHKERNGPTYAFVTYDSVDSAARALSCLERNRFGFRIEYAKPQKSRETGQGHSSASSSLGEKVESSSHVGLSSEICDGYDDAVKLKVVKTGSRREVSVKPPSSSVALSALSTENVPSAICDKGPNHVKPDKSQHERTCYHRDIGDSHTIMNNLIVPDGIIDIGMPPLKPNTDNCTYCGKEGPFVCSRCLSPYCSAACQKIDWPRHSAVCTTNAVKPASRNEIFALHDHVESANKQGIVSATDQPVAATERDRNVDLQKTKSRAGSHSPYNADQSSSQNSNHKDSSENEKCSGGLERSSISRRLSWKSRQKSKGCGLKQQENDNSSSGEKSEKSKAEVLRKPKASVRQDRAERPHLAAEKAKIAHLKPNVLSGEEKVKVCFVSSPDEFWVQREKNYNELVQIAKELNILNSTKVQVSSPTVGDLCCSAWEGKLYRCSVTEIHPNDTCTVYYIDYGNSDVVKKSELYCLSSSLTKYYCMAVRCKLAGVKPAGNMKTWSEEDVDFFSHLVLEKVMKSYVVKTEASVISVDLINENGMSISSILINGRNAESLPRKLESKLKPEAEQANHKKLPEVADALPQDSVVFEVPTCIGRLQKDSVVEVYPVLFEEEHNRLWNWINVGGSLKELQALQKALQNVSDDIAVIAEEGELAVAFSPQYQTWYRCFILKRNKNSFTVQYIDYGNEEEVTKLCRLSEKHQDICSPLFCFSTENIPIKALKKIVESDVLQAEVKSLTKDTVNLITLLDGERISVTNALWYKGLVSELHEKNGKLQDSPGTVVRDQKADKNFSPNKPASSVAPASQRPPEKAVTVSTPSQNDITRKCLEERELPVSRRTPVMVVWLVSDEEVHVHKTSDLNELHKLHLEINAWCSSLPPQSYVPVKGEIVCARFSEDGEWYRGYIEKSLPNKAFKVFFIDYGNEDSILPEDIRPLNSKFVCPKFTIPVCLSDVPPKLPIDKLHGMLLNKTFDLEVTHSKLCPKRVALFQDGKEVFATLNNVESHRNSPSKKNCAADEATVLQNEANNFTAAAVSASKKGAIHRDLVDFHNSEVRITHMNSSKHLHVQLLSRREELLSLQQDLFATFCKPYTHKYLPEIDDVVGAYTRNVWYRGFVTKAMKTSCVVHLFDFGYVDEVDIKNIRPLPDKFFHPMFSIPVVMNNVDSECLNDEVISSLLTRTLTLKFTSKDSDPPKVELLYENVSLNDFIAEPLDIASSPCVQKPQKAAALPSSKQTQHKKLYLSSLKSQSLRNNSVVDVLFVHREGDDFFVQRCEDLSEIVSMSAKLKQHCDQVGAVNHGLSLQEVVCARSSEDGAWYRASIQEIGTAGAIKVNFIDYGNSETVCKADIRELTDDLASYPIFCVKVVFEDCGSAVPEVSMCVPCTVRVDIKAGKVTVSLTECAPPTVPRKSPLQQVHSPKVTLNSLEHFTLPVNTRVHAMFVYSEGSTYYLQRVDDSDSITQMSLLLQQHCTEGEPPSQKLSVGEVVCARSAADMAWYRAVIKEIIDREKFEVSFIDFGNTEVVDKNSVCSMPQGALKYPVFCIPVSVVGRSGKAESAELNALYSVFVVRSEGDVAVRICSSDEPPSGRSSSESETAADNCNSVSSPLNSSNHDIGGGVKNSLSHSSPEKGEAHRVSLLDDCTYVEFPEGKSSVIVYSIKSVEEVFCAQFNEQNISANSELAAELNELCTTSNTVPYRPSVSGEMVIAKFPEDDCWYRATVIVVNPPEYEVLFPDYGGFAVLKEDSIRKIEQKYLKLQIQAHICRLGGFRFEEENEEAVNQELQKICPPFTQLEVMVSVDDKDSMYIVNSPLITDHLIKKGLATAE